MEITIALTLSSEIKLDTKEHGKNLEAIFRIKINHNFNIMIF